MKRSWAGEVRNVSLPVAGLLGFGLEGDDGSSNSTAASAP
jgi:hypothetical protein